MYTGLTSEICKVAWEISLEAVEKAAHKGVINKWAGTLIVLNPHDGEVLFRAQVNPQHPMADMYDEIALAKARVSWETGLPSRQVQLDAPHLYRPGMTKWGGAVVKNGLVVSFSGVQAVFDEATSWTVLNWILALCQYEMVRPGGVMDGESSYIEGQELSAAAQLDAAGAEAEQRMATE